MAHSNAPEFDEETRKSIIVPVELDFLQPKPKREPRRPTPYQRVLQTMQAVRRLGKPQDRGYGSAGRCIAIAGKHAAGSFEILFHCPADRYCVELRLTVDAPTDQERALISATCANTTNLQTFSTLFDLLAVRTECPTFDPSDTQGVMDGLDAVFGPRA